MVAVGEVSKGTIYEINEIPSSCIVILSPSGAEEFHSIFGISRLYKYLGILAIAKMYHCRTKKKDIQIFK